MTLAVRNTVLHAGAIIALLLLVSFGVVGYRLLLDGQELPGIDRLDNEWLLWVWPVDYTNTIASIAATGACGLLAAGVLVISARVFRQVNSAEVYFFALFLLGLSIEQLRLFQLYLLHVDVPIVFSMIVTRVIVIGRISGMLSLFTASLYAAGIEYPRTGSLTLFLVLLSSAFVYLVPVDTLEMGATLLHRTGGQAGLQLTLLIIGVLAAVNYVVAGARGHRERGFLIGLAAICIVVAVQIIWFVPVLPWLVLGVALLAYGALSFILVTRAHFLWY